MNNCTRHCILVLAMSLSSHSLFSQSIESWTRYYNGAQSDLGRKIAIDAANNVYVAGSSESKGGNPDYALVKYNPSGQQLWAARYDGPGKGDDFVFGLELDASGNAYVTGRSLGNGAGYDYATVKYNAAGAQEWVARYNGPGNVHDVAKDLKVDGSGNVYVTGFSDGSNSNVGNAIRTIKYNSSGAQQWVAVYDQLLAGTSFASREEANSLALDPSGNVYIAAVSGGMKTIKYNSSGIEEWVKSSGGSNGRKLLFDGTNIIATGWGSSTVKYTAAGDVVWEATYVGPGNNPAFQDMTYDGLGNVYVTGYISGVGTSSNLVTVKYGADGNKQWDVIYNGTYNGTDQSRAIALDNIGNVFIVGFSTVANGSRQGTTKIITIKYNNAGSQQWVAIHGTAGGDGFDLALDATGAIVVAGQSAPKTLDFTTIKYIDGIPTSVSPSAISRMGATYSLRNFPNPFKLNTTIIYELAREGHVSVRVYDLLGHEVSKLVDEKKSVGRHQVQFSAGRLPSGTYLYTIQSGNFTDTRRMIIEK